MQPRLSLGLPVYNGEKFIREALDAILAQTFADFELLVCDNASKDRTCEIVREYMARDPRIKLVENDRNIGAHPNFNRVFELTSAPYFRWVSHDDTYDPTCLERCVEVLDRNPDVILACTRLSMISEDGELFHYDDVIESYVNSAGLRFFDDPPNVGSQNGPARRFRDVLKRGSACQQLHGVIRRSALARTGLFRRYYGSDKVLLAELALYGRFHQLPERLFFKRVHPGMSFFLTTSEKREWNATDGAKGIPQVHMIMDYTKAIFRAPLTMRQRMRSFAAILSLFTRNGLWKRIFIPGPDNYLGWNLGSGQKSPG